MNDEQKAGQDCRTGAVKLGTTLVSGCSQTVDEAIAEAITLHAEEIHRLTELRIKAQRMALSHVNVEELRRLAYFASPF